MKPYSGNLTSGVYFIHAPDQRSHVSCGMLERRQAERNLRDI
jgi:hypothetical protein